MQLSNKAYDILKVIAIIAAPLCTFIAALCDIWGIPHGTEIAATVAAVNALLGAVLQHSTKLYNATLEAEDDNNNN